jgi:hypothetical protein
MAPRGVWLRNFHFQIIQTSTKLLAVLVVFASADSTPPSSTRTEAAETQEETSIFA